MTAYTVAFTVDIEAAEDPQQAARWALALLTEAIENVDPMPVVVTEHLSEERLLTGEAQPTTEVIL